MTKSGRKYIDRKETIADRKKLPNIIKSLIAVPCSTAKHSIESRFLYKLTVVEYNSKVLDVLVLLNDVCVVLSPDFSQFGEVIGWKRLLQVSNEEISGKFKKGAQVIAAGTPILQVSYGNGQNIEYITPLGGQLLELNDLLETTNYDRLEYVCVLMPNTVIPTLDGARDYDTLCSQIDSKRKDRSCHAWVLGQCRRGSTCRFEHDPALAVGFELSMNMDEKTGKDLMDSDITEEVMILKKQKMNS